MSEFLVVQSKEVSPTEVMDLRVMAGSTAGNVDIWQDCIEQSLCVVTARDAARVALSGYAAKGALVGIGFVAGNRRHVELTDLTVHREYQQQGIGQRVGREMLAFALDQDIRYISLTYDKEIPWLKQWYKREGFKKINFAMWHRSSLNL